MVSGKSITLISKDRLNCFSDEAVHKYREAVVDFDTMTARGGTLQAGVKKIQLITKMMSTMAKEIIQKVKTYIRHTEGCDQVMSGHMDRKTEGLYTMNSRHTVMVSKKDTKIDGERIHMG